MAAIGTFVGVMVFLGAGGAALAQDAPGASPASAGAVATDPVRDAALKTWLQKHFRIPGPELITLGPAFKTVIDGLLARQLIVSNQQGQRISTALFFDKDESNAVSGQFVDVSTDP